jgi:hypothetical protein
MFASRSKLMMVALFLVALSFGCSSVNQQIQGLPEDISRVTGQDISIVTDPANYFTGLQCSFVFEHSFFENLRVRQRQPAYRQKVCATMSLTSASSGSF